jgi:hypothetical protein
MGAFITLYQRFIRFLLHRVFAAWFMIIGSLMTLMDGVWVLMGKLTDAHGQPSGVLAQLAYVLMPLLGALLGLFMWRIYPYKRKRQPEDLLSKNPWE